MTPDAPTPYVRGAGGSPVDARRLLQLVSWAVLATIAVLAVVLGAETISDRQRLADLKHNGLHVDVTVTGCVGLATGTGITVAGYTCRGSFVLEGTKHVDLIRGSSSRRDEGSALEGVTLRHDTGLLYDKSALMHAHVGTSRYVTPLVLIAVVGAGAVLTRRSSRTARGG